MTSDKIKSIFSNFLFTVGVLMVVFGFIFGTHTAVKVLFFDTYPLDIWQEQQCDSGMLVRPQDPNAEEINEELYDKEQERCETRLNRLRDIRKATDLATSLATLFAGTGLAFIFRKSFFKS